MESETKWNRQAEAFDQADKLKAFREDRFRLPADVIYLDGNSLGPLLLETERLLREAVSSEWGTGLIRSWNDGWFDLPLRLGDLLAPLVGARRGEVAFTDSVTINLTKLAGGVLELMPDRRCIVTDNLNFPSDLYALQGLPAVRQGQVTITTVASPDGVHLPPAILSAAINEKTALVTVSHVVFKSGYRHDLQALAAKAHSVGALVLADLSHSAGAVPVDLEGWGVDLAVGCSYKYLNGGPGGPAFLYVRQKWQDRLPVVLPGWFGCVEPFAFSGQFTPREGIGRFLTGTPPVLSMRALEPGIEILRCAGIIHLHEKAIALGTFFEELFEAFLLQRGFIFASPRQPLQRGSHIALKHEEAYRINRALMEPAGEHPVVIPDFRAPDNLRLGLAPLIVSFKDVLAAVNRLIDIIDTEEFKRFDHARSVVT